MKYIDKNLNVYDTLPAIAATFTPALKTVFNDTEFTTLLSMCVNLIALYCPDISEYLIVFEQEDLTDDFNPYISFLKAVGFSCEQIAVDEICEDIDILQSEIFESLDFEKSSKIIKKEFKELIDSGYADYFLNKYGLDYESISLEKLPKNSDYELKIQPPKDSVEISQFYGFADFFKIWGKNHQHLILEANLVQQRSLKLKDKHGRNTPIVDYIMINGNLYESQIGIREVMYRFPPIQKGLESQCKIFQVETKKMVIPEGAISNFSKFLNEDLKTALQYCATDVFATAGLDGKQREFLGIIYNSFDMQTGTLKDTTGSNVTEFILKGIDETFGVYSKEDKKLVRTILNLNRIENLQNIPQNDFGVQQFLTVGGLLFTRMALKSYLKGLLSDCDLKSCYASMMSTMNCYLGEPVVMTFKYASKPLLKEALEMIDVQGCPDDGWFVRVSGEFTTGINTLLLSDLRFKPRKITLNDVRDISSNRKSIEKFNAFKTGKKSAESCLLSKQVKFGLITKATLEAIKLLPSEWVEEILNFKCDSIVFIPQDMICDTLTEYLSKVEELPEENEITRFDPKSGLKHINTQRYKNNVVLRFPIHKYWVKLAENRAIFKSKKEPVQEVFKLFNNSGYGVLACLDLASNNLMASNIITAGARAGCWMMLNALNGFGAITDGTSFSWEHVPYKQKFHDILKSNPEYLLHFDENIKSNIDMIPGQECGWIKKNLKSHMTDFYNIDESNYLINIFDYELKDETFLTTKGGDFVKNNVEEYNAQKYAKGVDFSGWMEKQGYTQKVTFFNEFYNTNSGNYVKCLDGQSLMIDGADYDFAEGVGTLKARSFQDKDKSLVNWYINAIKKYEQPHIYQEESLIKLGDGNRIAIGYLQSGSERIAHPMGFSKPTFKIMKLITRSQFVFKNEKQLRNFESNEETLANLSSEIGLQYEKTWQSFNSEELEELQLRDNDLRVYSEYAKHHSVGIGFELLALASNGDLQTVREKITEGVSKGCYNFNAHLHLSRNLKYGKKILKLLAKVIVEKKHADDDFRKLLENSADQPCVLTLDQENVQTFKSLTSNHED